MPRLVRKLLIAAASFAVALVAAEIVARVASDPPFDAAGAQKRAREKVDDLVGNRWGGPVDAPAPNEDDQEPEFRLHPYYGYDTGGADDWFSSELERLQKQRDKPTLDVVVIGGSVAAGFAKDCHRDLALALAEDPAWSAYKVRVWGHGRGGFRQPQLVHALEYMFEVGFQPDIVIELDGFNEVALGLQNGRAGVNPAMPSISHWSALATNAPLTPASMDAIAAVRRAQLGAQSIFDFAESYGLFHSALAMRIVDAKLDSAHARYAEANQAFAKLRESPQSRSYLVGPKFDASDDAVLEQCARLWVQCSIDMHTLCKRRGIRYVHVLQPTRHDEGSKPLTAAELACGNEPADWALGAKLGYPKLRAHAHELIEAGVEYVDASRVFEHAQQTLYYDVCHFAPEGNRILADTIVTALRTQAPPPSQSK